MSQGKGLTLEAAKASGVMEAIELYHAERIELPLKLGSARELASKHRLLDLAPCLAWPVATSIRTCRSCGSKGAIC